MSFLNQAAAQVREFFLSMTPGSRIAAGLLLTVVVVSLGYLFNHQMVGPDAYLMGGEPFPSAQLPAVEAAFAKAGLTDYAVEGNRVRIPGDQKNAYWAALADAGALPPQFGSHFDQSLAGDSPFLSKRDKLERLKVAKQKELAQIIRRMQGIENASVIFDVKEPGGLNPKTIATASVNVKPAGSEPLDAARVPMIRSLVSASIAGMKRENVTVTDLNGRTYPGGEGNDYQGDPSSDPYFSRKWLYEQKMKQQINESLGMIPGVVVQVSAQLDTELRHVERSVRHDPKTVPIKTRAATTTKNLQNTIPGGRIGVAAQAAQGPAGGAASVSTVATGRTSQTEEEDSVEETQNLVSSETVEKEIKGLIPKNVKVTVVVPSDYYLQIWKSKNPPEPGKEPKVAEKKDLAQIEVDVKKDIQNAVVALLPPVAAGTDPYPAVTVTTFQSLERPPLELPTTTEDALAWMGANWSTLGMGGLAFFSLLMLRSMVKSVPVSEPSADEPERPTLSLMQEDDDPQEDDDEGSAEQRLRRRIRKGPTLKDELSDIVREDPDAAATILSNWIANAG